MFRHIIYRCLASIISHVKNISDNHSHVLFTYISIFMNVFTVKFVIKITKNSTTTPEVLCYILEIVDLFKTTKFV